MRELIINTGTRKLEVVRDGEKVGVFIFNPDDIAESKKYIEFSERLADTKESRLKEAEMLDEHGTKMEIAEYSENLVRELRQEIDNIYNPGTSEMLFGDCINISTLTDFFEQLQPYYAEASKARKEKYKTK